MPSLDEVRSALSGLDGVSSFMGKREINELPNILWENELPEQVIQGNYNNRNGILVCTNSRLIFVDKGLVGLKVEDFPLNNISSIQYETGMLLGKITIFASGNRAEIRNVDKNRVRNFAEYVRAKISNENKQQAAPESPAQPQQAKDDEIIVKLERLMTLREQGILTDEELAEQKARILGQ